MAQRETGRRKRGENEVVEQQLKLGEHWVGDGHRCFVLAEIASAHRGDPDEVLALARLAKDSGADGVKFQLFRAEALVAPNDSRFEVFDQIELAVDVWHRLLTEVTGLGLPLFADIFDHESLEIAEEHTFSAYKIHSTDLENPDLIRSMCSTGKPILAGTGGVQPRVLAEALEWVREGVGERWMPMHGVQNFPTQVEDTGLAALAELRRTSGRPVGFLDHVDAGSEMATVLPAMAVVAGADLVEKHLTRNREAKGFDYESSLEAKDFARMVSLIRDAERAYGVGHSDINGSESSQAYHHLMRRAVVSARVLEAGGVLSRDDVVFLRNEAGLPPTEFSRIQGKRAKARIEAFEPLTESLFEG